MKKQITFLSVIAAATGLCLSLSLNAQNTFPASGNVGISTTTPGGLLQLLNTTHTSLSTVYSQSFAGTYGTMFRQSNSDCYIMANTYYNSSTASIRASAGGAGLIAFNASGEGNIDFYTAPTGSIGTAAALTKRMTLLEGGNFGIGTPSPIYKFCISNSGAAGIEMDVTGASHGGGFIQGYNRSNSTYIPIDYYALGHHFFLGGTEKLTIQETTGNLGINNPSPIAKLQVTNGSVLFDGTTGTTPVSGAGTRMMWIPAKGAFRAGNINGNQNQWDDSNIGTWSFASGHNTIASGFASFAANEAAIASGGYSSAFGNTTTASGSTSSAFGFYTIASDLYSSAFGSFTTASGQNSTTFGNGTKAQSYNSFVLGAYNISGAFNSTTWIGTDPLFVIGNGVSSAFLSNAVTVLKNGNTGIGTATPIQTLDVNGRINLANGVIQNGGAAITNTSDLGLYSLNAGYFMRFVTNNAPIRFYSDGNPVSNASLLSIESNGKVLIGNPATVTLPDGYKLYVETGILTEKMKISLKGTGDWSDYIFAKDYKLKPLEELENYIQANKHLPGIPPADEMVKNGLDVAAMDAKLLAKIEELTIYVIDLNRQNAELTKGMENLNKEINILKKK